MKNYLLLSFLFFTLYACKNKVETLKPTIESISESVYASGVVKSKNQYQVFANVNGIINKINVSEGDLIKKGSSLMLISNETSVLNLANAQLAADFSDYQANSSKLKELKINIELAKAKMSNDSLLYERQKNLWAQSVGSKIELEQKELGYKNSKTAYQSSILRYDDLKKQISYSSEQSKNNLQLSRKMENDYSVKSEMDGKVYSINKEIGEMVTTQTPLAIIGDATNYILELQVDEYDIVKVIPGQKIMVTLDSYKGEVFEAIVEKVDPIMNERSKTFTVKAQFTKQPKVLYPNLTVEANIVIKTKEKVMTLPRNYITKDNFVVNVDGEKIKVKIGLKDFQRAEILEGIPADIELIKPIE